MFPIATLAELNAHYSNMTKGSTYGCSYIYTVYRLIDIFFNLEASGLRVNIVKLISCYLIKNVLDITTTKSIFLVIAEFFQADLELGTCNLTCV